MRGRQEHRQLKWGDITVGQDENGRYLAFKERTTKTRQGESGDTREVVPKAYENTTNPDRCPVKLFEIYKECRPESMCIEGTPFYIAINNMRSNPGNRSTWFKKGPLGKNRLGNMMQDMAKEAGIEGKFCNHSVRRTSITNLLQAGVAPTLIKNISGHKNVDSISHYASASKAQIKRMNDILLNPLQNVPQYGQIQSPNPSTSASGATPSMPNQTIPQNSKNQSPKPASSATPLMPIQNIPQNSKNQSPKPAASVSSLKSNSNENQENMIALQNAPRTPFEMTQNQTAISGLLHTATLNNCIFNISYSLPANNTGKL